MGRFRAGLVSGVWVLLLFVALFGVVLNVPVVRAGGTIYIKADGSIDPPTAPIFSSDNITYIFTGNIYDEIVVERSNIIIDGNGCTVQGSGVGSGLSLHGIDYWNRLYNVTLKRANIKGSSVMPGAGVSLLFCNNATISANNLTENSLGMQIFSSDNNFVSDNIIANNSIGVDIWYSNGNTVFRNEITNNKGGNTGGFYLYASSLNNFRENNITNNSGYYGTIYFNEGSNNNTVSHNNIVKNGRGIGSDWFSYYNVIYENNITANEHEGIYLYGYCNSNTIYGNNITNNEYGIWSWGSSDNNISRNIVKNNKWGIGLYYSSNNFLRDNVMTGNSYNFGADGVLNDVDTSNTVDDKPIYYWVSRRDAIVPLNAGYVALVNCSNIRVENLTLTKNGQGIQLANTVNSTIYGNNIANNEYGILLDSSSTNSVSRNNVTTNYWIGISFSSSSDNSVNRNNITANDVGVGLYNSSNNSIYHNNFIDNSIQVMFIENSLANIWDDGHPSGGNYWSNYTGVDANGDAIGDTPYIIDANNTDRYPLMAPFSTFDAGIWNGVAYNVDVVSNSTVSGFQFNPSEGALLRFNVTGDDGTAGFCRVAIPKDLLWVEDGWTVYVGEESVNYEIIPDNDYAYLYFTYNHSTQTVIIQGTHVIPEFTSFIILPLLALITFIATILLKKKRKTKPQLP